MRDCMVCAAWCKWVAVWSVLSWVGRLGGVLWVGVKGQVSGFVWFSVLFRVFGVGVRCGVWCMVWVVGWTGCGVLGCVWWMDCEGWGQVRGA